MRLGIVGVGVVGSAIEHGFRQLEHRVCVHDIKLGTTIRNVLDTQIAYVCVPTPPAPDGSCDTRIVHSVVDALAGEGYRGVVAIKSTVEPGTTSSLIKQHPELRIAHVPEFLRERCAVEDFMHNHDVCVIGTHDQDDYALVKASHGDYPRKFLRLTPTEAELAKYFNNVYNAMLITFANNFREVCDRLGGADYTRVKNGMVLREHIFDRYLDSCPSHHGFGGACLPKDTRAFRSLCGKLTLDVELFDAIVKDNDKHLAFQEAAP